MKNATNKMEGMMPMMMNPMMMGNMMGMMMPMMCMMKCEMTDAGMTCTMMPMPNMDAKAFKEACEKMCEMMKMTPMMMACGNMQMMCCPA